MLPLNDMPQCCHRYGVATIKKRGSTTRSFKLIPFHCGLLSCPICRKRKKAKLLRRLNAAAWPPRLIMWTITTDPKVLSPEIALKTMNRRWHLVCRHLLRRYPAIRFFRILEFTESGLPHFHILFDRFVDWHWFQSVLCHHRFGKVLHFKTLPRNQALTYTTKYITKAYGQHQHARDLGVRMWSASLKFLPILHYFEDGTEFRIIYTTRDLLQADAQMRVFQFFADNHAFP